LLSSNISSTCPHNMVNFGPLAAEIGPCSLGHLSKFQSTDFASWQRYCSDVAQRKPTKLCTVFTVSWAGTRRTHFWRFFPRYGILPGAKFTLHSILALLYFGNITAWHSSSGREPNFAALSPGRHLYSARRPSRWALAHILVRFAFSVFSVLINVILFLCCLVLLSDLVSSVSSWPRGWLGRTSLL